MKQSEVEAALREAVYPVRAADTDKEVTEIIDADNAVVCSIKGKLERRNKLAFVIVRAVNRQAMECL